MLNFAESDNTDVPRREKFHQVALVEYLQRNIESMYPQIGRETYRVPDVHINKGKEGEVNEEGVMELMPPTDTDIRSDRAHSFISDMIYLLSTHMKKTKVGPFFMINSYEYDDFLSRLKTSFEEKLCRDVGVHFPKGSGHDRGEIDILISLPKHIIFVEVKAIGDNFNDYEGDKGAPIRDNIRKATNQLLRDEKVFDHVMADLHLQNFKRTKVAALPNLERDYLTAALEEDGELKQKCQGFLFLCKEDMPKSRLHFMEDFHVFRTWWINNVFPEIHEGEVTRFGGTDEGHNIEWSSVPDKGSNAEADLLNALDEVKVIVGRYIGFMSVVKVCNKTHSKLHRVQGLIEGRRKGQMVWYVGERFANIVLTPDQKRYLDTDLKLGYLCGPPGSGKTVVLSLRARRWILNDGNFVVVVNMYRGAAGRAIGKQILKTITENSDEHKESTLKRHTMEIGVDVSTNIFQKQEFVNKIRSKWGDEIGECGERILFIVDETYVQSYWNCVFQTLRQEFASSAMWCAGLYGKQPDAFTSLQLTKVIRCPPNVQLVLSLVDWVEERRRCYITDSTVAALPTNGPHVLTVRHHKHTEYAILPPAQCPLCGLDLVHIFKRLQVCLPGRGHTDPDLQLWSLRCSEIVILVNMPRSLYRRDDGGYLDTTVTRYKEYMLGLKNCAMLNKLNESGYPTRVHTDLSCSQLVTASTQELINVTWIYTYQGLENKVIIFIPGDEAMPQQCDEEYLTEPSLNIPCPGLMASEEEVWNEVTNCLGSMSGDSSESESFSGEEIGASTDSEDSDNSVSIDRGRQTFLTDNHSRDESKQPFLTDNHSRDKSGQTETDSLRKPTGTSSHDTMLSENAGAAMEEQIFYIADINRYTRWDKSNLFVSASRCTSQLILITR
ncbi:hypothetical protein BsWGS_22962 [Bradybaena similaris]